MAGEQGAHGFRAQSRWAPRVGAFINLESTGPGGPDFVFQARPGTHALLRLTLLLYQANASTLV